VKKKRLSIAENLKTAIGQQRRMQRLCACRMSKPRIVSGVCIFIAVWIDGQRRLMTERLEQRKIRIEA
jgi:hypothetical protein